MNLMERWMKMVSYRITEGSEYSWDSFGPHAQCLDSWNGEQDGWSSTITFDRENQTCYMLELYDYKNTRAYRWVNPDFNEEFRLEVKNRNCGDDAWDCVKFIDLEVVDDYFDKGTKIYQGLEYDTRVSVPIDLSDDEMFRLMMMAHEHDLTLNQMVEKILREQIERIKENAEHSYVF